MTELSIDIQLSAPKLIKKHLQKNGSTVAWLSRNVHIAQYQLYGYLSGTMILSEKNRKKINDFLQTDY